ncbi:putative heat-labile enterotoxin [Ophiocordyceps polyrhachis-furcata BCC 54312]|uniref:Heat-labile enterotoxin n=1 Tax=Ophiocordyceps polyrhachis-furcata BCC 54312 TaxID=1330021 RepID=A0A367L1Y2_9HYPO|nr:putative heat-labile enterotoxin [Ophiocordyceps polyrhachis-furcata BCC 54312]
MRRAGLVVSLWLSCLGSASSTASSISSISRRDGESKQESVLRVYRGDTRSPQEIRAQGGFQPLGRHWSDNPQAFSIDRHFIAGISNPGLDRDSFESAYVSFSREQSSALRYGDWLYEVHALRNMLDPCNVYAYPDAEVFALGGAQWSQVVRFRWVHDQNPVWTLNTEYAELVWEKSAVGGTQTDVPKVLLDQEESNWDKAEVREAAMDYMASSDMVSALGTFPHKFEAYPPRDDIPGPRDVPQRQRKELSAEERRQREEFIDWLDVHCKRDGSVCLTSLEKLPESEGDDFPRLSEELASQDFEHLAIKYGVAEQLAKRPGKLSTSDLRGLSKGYQPLAKPTTRRVKIWGVRLFTVALLGLYTKDVVDVFSRDTSALDRAAVVTSIVPFVGCGVGAAAKAQHNQTDLADTTLCLVGDALFLTPAWPLGLVVHFSRFFLDAVRDYFYSTDRFQPETLTQRQTEGWLAYCKEVERYMHSAVFEANIRTQYMAELAAVVSRASQARAELMLGAMKLIQANPTTLGARDKIGHDMQSKKRLIEQLICVDASSTKERLRDTFIQASNRWMLNQHEQYTEHFYRELRSRAASDASTSFLQSLDAHIRAGDSVNGSVVIPTETLKSLGRAIHGHIDKLANPSPCRVTYVPSADDTLDIVTF